MKTMIAAAALVLGLMGPAALARAEGGGDPGKGPGMGQAGGDEQGGGKMAKMAACKGDVEKFCKDVEPGGGRIIRCLKKHSSDVTDGCKDALKEMREERQERRKDRSEAMKDACKDDVEKLCKDVQPGGGKIVGCLREHKDSVSDGCKKAMRGGRKKGGEDEGKGSDKSGGDEEKGGGDEKGGDSD